MIEAIYEFENLNPQTVIPIKNSVNTMESKHQINLKRIFIGDVYTIWNNRE